jgi:hypothetical protein
MGRGGYFFVLYIVFLFYNIDVIIISIFCIFFFN